MFQWMPTVAKIEHPVKLINRYDILNEDTHHDDADELNIDDEANSTFMCAAERVLAGVRAIAARPEEERTIGVCNEHERAWGETHACCDLTRAHAHCKCIAGMCDCIRSGNLSCGTPIGLQLTIQQDVIEDQIRQVLEGEQEAESV